MSLTNAAGQIVFFKNLGQINLYNGYTSTMNISGIPSGAYTLMFQIANTMYSQKVVLK